MEAWQKKEDQEQIRLILEENDQQALDSLFEMLKRQTPVIAEELKQTSHEFDEDVCMDAYISVRKALPSFNGRSKLSVYCWSIVQYTYYKYIARDKKRKKLVKKLEREESHRVVDSIINQDVSIRISEEAIREKIKPCLDQISHEHRQILHMRYWEGKTYAEIAQLSGKSLSVVKRITDQKRAPMSTLKKCLNSRGYKTIDDVLNI